MGNSFYLRKTTYTLALLVTGYMQGYERHDQDKSGWSSAGQGLANLRSQPDENKIDASNVHGLKTKWVFTTGGDISATPTVSGNAIYLPDGAGTLFAVNKEHGDLIWSRSIAEYTGAIGSMSRVSPLVLGDELIIGENTLNKGVTHNGTHVIAVGRESGKLKWITQVDKHPAAVITGSPVSYNDVIYVGVSSSEEGLADIAGYPCCTFRGSMVALDAHSGKILWKTFSVPENHGNPGGYSGGAIWQPPAIDPARGLLYVGTGNNYSVPSEVEDCEDLALADNQAGIKDCTARDDYFDSALALDLRTGHIRWARKLKSYDTWTVACIVPKTGVTCPSPAGPDFDFGGSGPNLLPHMVGFGQKSGIYWALDPDNGRVIWTSVAGPGGTLGGIEWGSAGDNRRIYLAVANSAHLPYKIARTGATVTSGAWSALDARSGEVLWQTPDPTAGNTIDTGAVSIANGVVFAGSYSGTMYAMEARTGKILWSFASGGSVVDGPSIVDGVVYWGSGYRAIAPGKGNNQLYAFEVERSGH